MATAVVIDDSPLMRRRMQEILQSASFEIVGEALDAEQLLAQYPTLRPTLIVMDIVLPGRDGITVASELLRRHPEALIIMCSSLSQRDKIVACQKAGVAYYLMKPFDADKLKSVAKFVLATKGKRAALSLVP